MSILERPYGLASLTESLAGLGRASRIIPSWDDGPGGATTSPSTSSPRLSSFPADVRGRPGDRPDYAAAHGLRVAPQRTGHNASTDRIAGRTSILLKTDRARHGRDRPPPACRARVGAGVKWETVVPRASESASRRCTAPPRT